MATAATADVEALEPRYADLAEVRLHYVEAGEGPLVVLLHGFPDFWYSWRRQIPALAAAGFRVVAPDMRGYDLSDKPGSYRDYRIEHLTADVRDLIHFLGEERAHVAGHDWGAAVAWSVPMQHPEVVDRLAILNVPHPQRMFEGLQTFRQLRKSWYMFFFQIPWLPEAMLGAGNCAALRKQTQAEMGASDAEMDRYVQAWSQPGALTGGINYYRAALRRSRRQSMALLRPFDHETLVLWGEQDPHLGKELAEPPRDAVPNARTVRFPDAGHWVHVQAADRVNDELIAFLR